VRMEGEELSPGGGDVLYLVRGRIPAAKNLLLVNRSSYSNSSNRSRR